MEKKKSIDELSAEELYELAKAKEAEEREREKQALREQREALKAERRALLARHRKELADIDARIRQLDGRGSRRNSGGTNISATVLDILSDKKPHSTREIKAALEKRHVVTDNLAQTLSYLKRQGKIKSTERAVYTAA